MKANVPLCAISHGCSGASGLIVIAGHQSQRGGKFGEFVFVEAQRLHWLDQESLAQTPVLKAGSFA